MNPWELLLWVGVVALSLVIAALAALIVAAIVKALLPDKGAAAGTSEEVFRGSDN